MAVSLTELAAEVANDPAKLGLATVARQGDYDGIVRLLNDTGGGVKLPVPVGRGDFLLTIAAAHLRVPALADATKRATWDSVLSTIRAVPSLRVGSAAVQALLTAAVADGAITSGEKAAVDALGLRPGSRAEQLWGEGTVVGLNDVCLVLQPQDSILKE